MREVTGLPAGAPVRGTTATHHPADAAPGDLPGPGQVVALQLAAGDTADGTVDGTAGGALSSRVQGAAGGAGDGPLLLDVAVTAAGSPRWVPVGTRVRLAWPAPGCLLKFDVTIVDLAADDDEDGDGRTVDLGLRFAGLGERDADAIRAYVVDEQRRQLHQRRR